MTLSEFCVRLMHPEKGRVGRQSLSELARKAGEKAFMVGCYDPDAATLEFADIVHNRLGVPQGDFCYSFVGLPEFSSVREAVDFYTEEREAGEIHAFNTL